MACSCKGRSKAQYTWTSDDGETVVIYSTEIEAKAKVIRAGGSYVKTV